MSSKNLSSKLSKSLKLSKKSCKALTLVISGVLVLCGLFLLNKYVFKINENFQKGEAPMPTNNSTYYADEIYDYIPPGCGSIITEKESQRYYDDMMSQPESSRASYYDTLVAEIDDRCRGSK